jgi:hypothetical protein
MLGGEADRMAGAVAARGQEVGNEAAVGVGQLLGHALPRVAGVDHAHRVLGGRVEGRLSRAPLEHLHRPAAGVEVELIAVQALDVGHAVAPEVAQHVVKGAPAHHHDDDVADLAQARERGVSGHVAFAPANPRAAVRACGSGKRAGTKSAPALSHCL